ncbi:MAG TPA: DUF309 domain-containing protein [Candidatus Binatia bacterium]|nr:DUF309 domain-containing protein [Candidatus Binatia bacterium]
MSRETAGRHALIAAAREFNAGRYFEAHEALEDALDEVPDALWDLFNGLIQIAVGYHKATQQLWSGALRMLDSGLQKVAPYPANAGGINLDAFRERVCADIDRLRAGDFDSDTLAHHPPRLQPLVVAHAH